VLFRSLAGQLAHVQPQQRQQLAELAAAVAEKTSSSAQHGPVETPRVAARRE
jgi:hypothetical protein